MKVLLVLNNYMHDFSGALFIASSIVLFVAGSRIDLNSSEELKRYFLDLFDRFKPLLYISIFGIIVFGIVRLITFRWFEANAIDRDSLVALVAYKHLIIAIMVFGGAVMWSRLLRKKRLLKESINEG